MMTPESVLLVPALAATEVITPSALGPTKKPDALPTPLPPGGGGGGGDGGVGNDAVQHWAVNGMPFSPSMRLFTVAVPELIKYQWLLPALEGKATRISSVLIVPNDGLESNVPDMNMDMLLATAPTSLVAVPPTAEYVKLGFASGTLNVIGFADAKWNGLATVSSWPKSLRR